MICEHCDMQVDDGKMGLCVKCYRNNAIRKKYRKILAIEFDIKPTGPVPDSLVLRDKPLQPVQKIVKPKIASPKVSKPYSRASDDAEEAALNAMIAANRWNMPGRCEDDE